jgi:hypothetical protein
VRLAWPCLALAIATGCSFDTSGASATDGGTPRPDGDTIDAEIADASAPDAAQCTGETLTCLDGTHFSGCIDGLLHLETCDFGCLTTPEAHCGVPQLSNGLDLTWLDGADRVLAVPPTTVVVFDTTSGTVQICGADTLHSAAAGIQGGINFQIRPAASAGDVTLGVWAFRSLRVDAASSVRVIGDKPAAFLIADDVRLEGNVDVSGGVAACDLASACGMPPPTSTRSCGGPGGGVGGLHDQDGAGEGHGHKGASGGATVAETGGGGAGYGAVGGAGGGKNVAEPGVVYGVAALEPLFGGSGGGGGGEATASTGQGGGGGGGLQISALGRIEVLADVGKVRAGGAGGGAGTNSNGGGGGGSGGAILLEAAALKITGVLAANGGGGGGSALTTGAQAGNGGLAGASPAAGGGGAQPGGNGGSLASGTGAPGSPVNSAVDVDGTGGGGGGVGRIFLRALAGAIELSGATVSPAAGQDTLIVK